MSRNNRQHRLVLERKNFKLYKAKKQWATACATVLAALGTTAAVGTSAHADAASNSSSDPVAEVKTAVDTGAVTKSATTRENQATLTTSSTVTAAPTEAGVKTQAGTQDSLAVDHQTPQESHKNDQTTLAKKSVPVVQSAKTTTDQTNISPSQPTPVTPHADSSENAAPIAWTGDYAYVVVDTDLTNLASKFLQNGAELEAAGAKITLVGDVPKPTQADIDNL